MSRDSGPNVFQRGVMALILLSLLRREDMYGYQLVQETERRSGGRLKTQEGSLYPVLYRLQEQGLISDHRVLVGKRMTRVYYHLEPAGEARLEEMIREYESMMTVLLIGPPGVGKTQIMEQIARECEIGLVAYTITHHTRQSAVGLPFIEHKIYGGKEYSVTEYTMSEIIASVYDRIRETLNVEC